MSDVKDNTLEKLEEKFIAARKLLEKHETQSTEKEPYKMKYAAIKILKELEMELENLLNCRTELVDLLPTMLVVVHLHLGVLHADTEELKAGEEQFMKCVNLLKGKESDPEFVLIILSALNQLGIIWSRWNQPVKAKAFLERAKMIYKEFIDTEGPCRDPVNMAATFGIEDSKNELSPKHLLEKIHTLTLFYLAQIHGVLKDHHKSSVYCHMTLRRQLCQNDVTQDLDYVEWALNAATLSQYLMENERFAQAKHHLSAASHILEKYENILKSNATNVESETHVAEWENYKHRSADVARCWAKYGILLLTLSTQRLLLKTEKDENEQLESENEQLNTETEEKDKEKYFDDLKFDTLIQDIEPIANQITDSYLLDFSDAKSVFLNVQKWLDQAKTYYTLEDHASDYIKIVQDMSEAYKQLAFFEENEDRQAKMHKRRVDILENTIKELNPQYYKAACKQIWTELGETYSIILDIKLDRLRLDTEKPTAQSLTKINFLARNGIKNFQMFIDSLETIVSSNDSVQFTDDVVQAALNAYFHIGRLYNKLITLDKHMQLENTQNSINAFKFIVNYCEKHQKAAEIMKTELHLCKEILNLLLMKIDKLRKE